MVNQRRKLLDYLKEKGGEILALREKQEKYIEYVKERLEEKIKVEGTSRIRTYRDMSSSKLFMNIAAAAPGSIDIEGPYQDENNN